MPVMNGYLELAGQTGWAVGAAAVAVLVALLYWKSCADARKLKGVPPGSFGLPVLGETLDFLGAAKVNNIAEFYSTRAANFGEVFKTHLFFNPAVSVSAPDGNKFLFANENKLVQNSWPASVAKQLGQHSLANKVGDEHIRVRKIFTTFFNEELQEFVTRMDALTRAHMSKYWEGKDRILGVPTVKEFAFAVAVDLFLSLRDDDPRYRPLESATEDYLAGILQLPIDLPRTAFRKGRLGREAILRIVDTFITERKQDLKNGKAFPRQDLLSVLLSTRNEDDTFMSEDEIKDDILLMLFAGHDTSSITLALVLKYLHLNPECLREVIKEQREIANEKEGAALNWHDTRRMRYTWRVCQETLRLQPPVQGAFRKAVQEFKYGGYTIPKGWTVFWSTGRSHKLPVFFPNPEKFDPTRFEGSGPPPYVFIPFGGGPRMCLGSEFARTEMMVFLHHLVLNFEWKMVDPNEEIRIDPIPLFKNNMQLNIYNRDNI